jgi:putative transposase
MSWTQSPSTGKPYGVERVCAAWGVPRSSYYSSKRPVSESPDDPPRGKRGPKAAISDSELLSLIRADLETSPFVGEGHRKVWARLRFGSGVMVGRKRVLRIMREANLLSPHRRPAAPARAHDGVITTDDPDIMWGTDGARVFTAQDGWGWIFVAIEHWNAEVMGWHVTKKGNRFAALEPIAQSVLRQFGSVEAGAARGVALRMDHGSQYLSDHFQKQIKAWGMAPSFAFLEQPQTNGVAERFFRTLKEQVVYGRAFNTIEELRQAVGEFVELYNRQWLIEKNGYLSPHEAREAYYAEAAA